MSEPVTIVLLGAPVGFARTRPSATTGYPITPQRQRNVIAEVRILAMQEMAGRALLDGPLRIELMAEFAIPRSWSKKKQIAMLGRPAPRKPDYDNLAKLLTDAFNQRVYRDDAQVTDATIQKRYGLQPKMVITIAEVAK